MEEKKPIIIRNGKIWDKGTFRKADILIENDIIKEVSDVIDADNCPGEILEAEGKYILPGLIDMHVHFREPGFSYKETIKAGSEAAAAGGFTTVCTMPNLKPAPDSLENLNIQLDIISRDSIINVLPFATITKNRLGHELVDYAELAPFVAGFSDDGSGVQSEEVMRRAMTGIAKTGKILSAHCEVNSLLEGGYIHKGEYALKNNHKGICSESEWKEVERDIKLAEETVCRLHVCHISTKESVALIRDAKARGVKVTCETGPHYLTFCDDDLKEEGRFKMNPPIRSYQDRDALREGVADGTIDVIATDHAPHSESEKSKGLEKSAMGVVGLETAFASVYTTMVTTGIIPFEKMVELMAINPSRILGLGDNSIIPGAKACLTIVDTGEEFVVDPSTFKTMGRATPYQGMRLRGKIISTIYNGKILNR